MLLVFPFAYERKVVGATTYSEHKNLFQHLMQLTIS